MNLFAQPPAQRALALLQQGFALHQQGQAAQALQCYEQVLQLQPKNFDALHLSGVLALQAGDAPKAMDLFNRALKVDRNSAMAYDNRGSACMALQQYDLALINFNKAIALAPGNVNALNNRGNLHVKLGQFDAALADFDQALALQPDYFEALNNRSNTLSGMGRHEEAHASSQRAVGLQPQSAAARWNLGMNALRLGHFDTGWADCEARLDHWRQRGWQEPNYAAAKWTGAEPLAGQTLLMHCEQGLGDTLQFCRYAAAAQAQGAQVLLQVQPPLKALLQTLPGVTVLAQGEPLPHYDLHCHLLSLPLAFKTDLGNIPPVPDALCADAAKVALWQARLGEGSTPRRLRVGIAWSGNAAHVDDRRRSMALQDLLPLLTPDVQWVSLQKELRPADAALLAAHPDITHFGDALQDFTDTAALCELMDLVICVDTSVAHLAANLGKPVWLLLAQHTDWRWLLKRTDTPWYPSMTLYRQPTSGDWASVVSQVQADLGQRVGHGV
jgi:tetratricopeptide (TPR) repeat protein